MRESVVLFRFCWISHCYFCDVTWWYSRETQHGVQHVRYVRRAEVWKREEMKTIVGCLRLDIDKNGKVDSKEMEQIVTVGTVAQARLCSCIWGNVLFRLSMICSAKRIAKERIRPRNVWRRSWPSWTWTAIDRWPKMNSSTDVCKMTSLRIC